MRYLIPLFEPDVVACLCSWLVQPAAASLYPLSPVEPKASVLGVVGYIFGILRVLLASTCVLTPIGAAGSAEYVSEEPLGGCYVEYDDTVDEYLADPSKQHLPRCEGFANK